MKSTLVSDSQHPQLNREVPSSESPLQTPTEKTTSGIVSPNKSGNNQSPTIQGRLLVEKSSVQSISKINPELVGQRAPTQIPIYIEDLDIIPPSISFERCRGDVNIESGTSTEGNSFMSTDFEFRAPLAFFDSTSLEGDILCESFQESVLTKDYPCFSSSGAELSLDPTTLPISMTSEDDPSLKILSKHRSSGCLNPQEKLNSKKGPSIFVIGDSAEDISASPREEKSDKTKDKSDKVVLHVVPPDGGWGWVVVGASFLCNAVVDGIIFTSGMLFPRLRETFGVGHSEVAWISSLLGGFYLLVGPFVSGLANAFGFRTVCILGAFVSASACAISYFATSLAYLYCTFGILGGIGFGMIYVPAVIATGFYFEKRRALATGIAVCGSGIGNFVMSPINAFLLTSLGDRWRIIFLVYAGISLSCAIFGLAFRPLSAATGKKRKADDDLEVPGTPLLIRIKRARDQELAQCPSALSMNSSYSRSASKVTLEEHAINGDLKPPTPLARSLLERHGGGISKRFSYPGIVVSGPEPILEESELPGTDDDGVEKETDNGMGNGGETSSLLEVAKNSSSPLVIENGSATKSPPRLLDKNKNETNHSQGSNPQSVKETPLTVESYTPPAYGPNGKCPRNMSEPALGFQPTSTYLENRRRSSRGHLRQEVTRPFYRDDIFYSGSLARIAQYKSSETIGQYIASVTHLPPADLYLPDSDEASSCCPCMGYVRPVLQRIFDFSLLSSATFIILAVSGFLALLSLFVPFSFLPSYAMDVGISPSDTSFLMSLIGICNTVGRIIAGWVSDHPKVDALLVNNLALIIGGAGTALLPLVSDLSLMYLYTVVFGLSIAAFASLRSILLVELLGLERLTNAFGLLLLFQGLAATFGSPIAGAFVDLTSGYNLSFYVFGGIFAFAGIVCIPLRIVKKWEDDRLDRKLRKAKYGVE